MNGLSAIDTSAFRVGLGTHLFSGAITGFPRFWSLMGRLESWALSEQLDEIVIEQPVYVTGLARAGTTVLLEILASHPDVVTHRYSDFPALFTPYWWGQANKRPTGDPTERAHGDGLMVTAESPEAMEEILWMANNPHLHDPAFSQVLDENYRNDKFESQYTEHIRKLLLLRNGKRYAAKGNYNLTRLGYIQTIFPDAHFLVAVRNPIDHVASLLKQHRLFCAGEADYPRAIAHLQRVGHFEFGLDRRPINVGDDEPVAEIQALWANGEEVRGWAKYWSMLYGWLSDFLEKRPELRRRVAVVRYEDLCENTLESIESALTPLGLWDPTGFADWENRIKQPSYYTVDFSENQRSLIEEETAEVRRRYGYE